MVTASSMPVICWRWLSGSISLFETEPGTSLSVIWYYFISSCSYSQYLYNRPHPCTTCQEDFASSEDLVQHLATRHDGAGIAASCDDVYRDSQLDKPFQCCNPGCGMYFKTLTGKSHCLTLIFHEVAPKFVWKV